MNATGLFGKLTRSIPHPTGLRVALHVEETAARLLVARGGEPVQWRSVTLPPGMVQNGVVADPVGLAGQIDVLFDAESAPRSRVLVSVGGLHGIVRSYVLPKLKPAMLGEALWRELRRDVQVPLEEHHLVSVVLRTTSEQMEALVLAVPRGELNALNQTMKLSRIRAAVIEWKPLSLARAVNAADAAIVCAEANHFDIVVVRDGAPAVIRSVPYPQLGMSRPTQMEIAGSELAVTLGYGIDERDAETGTPQRVFLLGEGMDDESLRHRFEGASGHTLEAYPWSAEGMPGAEYAAAWGMVLRSLGPRKGSGTDGYRTVSVPDLSLPEWKPRQIPTRQGLWAIGIAIAVGAVAMPLYDTLGPDAEAASLRASIATMERESRAQRNENNRSTARVAEVEVAEARVSTLRTQLSEALGRDLRWPRLGASLSIPDVNISSVAEDGATLSISGTAGSYRDVVAYTEALRSTGGFKDVFIRSLTADVGLGGWTATRFQIAASKATDGGNNAQ